MKNHNLKHIVCAITNDPMYDQRMIRICTSLQNAGFNVTLVGYEKKNSKPLDEKPYRQVRLKIKATKGKAFYLGFHLALKRFLLAQKKLDIIYAVDLDTLSACAKISKRLDKKLVYDAHEYFTELPEVIGRPIVKSIWGAVAKRYIPKTDLCITVSESLGKVLDKTYQKTFHIIRNVPTMKALKPAKKSKKIILYQGVLNEGRGIESAILAMKYIEGAVFWIAGMGQVETKLRAMVEQNKLENKVIFKGYLLPHDLVNITNTSWLGINLLEGKSLNYFYSLANKFFDYMMAGIPSLNMNFPEYQAILSKHPMGLLTDDLDPKNIAKLINDLMNNPTLYQSLVQSSISAQSVYNWEVEEKKLIRLMNRLL